MESFPIIPASGRVLWIVFAVVLLVTMLAMGLLYVSARGARASRFEIDAGGLRLHGDLYGRYIERATMRLDEARIVNLAETRELQPRMRTMGTAVPGYRSGWFKLRNGEKSLLYLTDGSRAVYVPTTAGFSLLLSPQRPDRFLERLREPSR